MSADWKIINKSLAVCFQKEEMCKMIMKPSSEEPRFKYSTLAKLPASVFSSVNGHKIFISEKLGGLNEKTYLVESLVHKI